MLNYLTTHLQTFTKQLRRDDRGATMVEYGLMVALIAVAVIGIVTTLGTNLTGIFTTVANAVAGA